MITVTFTCPNCGGEHEYECEEEEAEEEAATISPDPFLVFTDKLEIMEDERALSGKVCGREWISNGHILTTPERVIPCPKYKPFTQSAVKDVDGWMARPGAYARLTVGPVGSDGSKPVRRLDGAIPVFIAERYHAPLADCDEWWGRSRLDPVLVYSNGVLQGIVMPIRLKPSEFVEAPK